MTTALRKTDVPLDLSGLLPGFADPTRGSQAAFRAIMNATARPGTIANLASHADAPQPPAGLNRAAAAAALTLVDQDTPLWLDPALRGSAAETWLRFHCTCPLVDAPIMAAFAIVADPAGMPALADFNQGDAKYPDRAATLILLVPALTGGPVLELRGPGIADVTMCAPLGLSPAFWDARADLVAHFQYGIDLMLCGGGDLLSIPRTTRITAAAVSATPGA